MECEGGGGEGESREVGEERRMRGEERGVERRRRETRGGDSREE